MQTAFRLLTALCLMLLAGCSSDSIKRNVYHSVQTMKQQECQQQPGNKCPPPESYNKYQQQRNEAIGEKPAN